MTAVHIPIFKNYISQILIFFLTKIAFSQSLIQYEKNWKVICPSCVVL